jgi:ketosteroid isomerase-like protein
MPRDLPITETKVVEFLKRFEDASATKVFANVVGMIHPNALFRFNDGDYRGLEAVQRAFESTWAHNVKDERYCLSDIEVVSVDTSSAAATFHFSWSGIGQHGPFQIVGRGTSLLVLHDGKLKVMVEHLSR